MITASRLLSYARMPLAACDALGQRLGTWCCLLLGLSLAAGNASAGEGAEASVLRLLGEYRRTWLANDSIGVLSLFTDDATIIPHGSAPLIGKEALRAFWFPPSDGSKTIIENFEIVPIEIHAGKDHGHILSNGRLTWTYENSDGRRRTQQEFSSLTIFRLTESGWKISMQIWTDRNVRRQQLADHTSRRSFPDGEMIPAGRAIEKPSTPPNP